MIMKAHVYNLISFLTIDINLNVVTLNVRFLRILDPLIVKDEKNI